MNKKDFWAILFFLLLPFILLGQIKIHKHLTIEDGLVDNRIFSIIQDSKGYMWFATSNGVSRWDGNNFLNLQKRDGLAASQVFDVAEGLDSTIYLTTYGGGITFFKNNKIGVINKLNGLNNNWISKLHLKQNGDIYIAGQYNLSILSNGKIKTIIDILDKPHGTIWNVHESKDGTLYICTHHGLKFFKNDSLRIFNVETGLANNTIWSIAEDKNGVIYLGTNRGISKFIDGKFSNLKFKGKMFNAIVPSILVSSDNVIYYATSKGLLIEKNNKLELLTEANGLSQNEIWSLAEDQNGTIYVGTKGRGVDIFSPEKIESFSLKSEFNSHNVLSICQDKKNNYYFGTDNGLLISNNNTLSDITKSNMLNNSFINIIKYLNDQIVLGLNYKLGILKNDGINQYSIDNTDKTFNRIHSIIKTQDNRILIGSQSGPYFFENEKFKRLKNENGKVPTFVQSALLSKDGSIILGTHGGGVFFLENGAFKNINENNGLTNSVINSIYQKANGTLLIGTDQGGLNILKNYVVTDTIDINKGLISNTILNILEDQKGTIYITTPRGISVLTFYAGEPFIRTITKKDGLISNNLNRNAAYLDSEGILWFGTTEGITKYNPNFDRPIINPPKIYLKGIEIFNKKYPLDKFLIDKELNYNQNYIRFIFTGINLSAPEKILYMYRLSGIDKDWVKSTENSAPYTNLDNGHYTFEVKTRNEWGYWSKPISASFTITPAWWETWWFYSFIILSIGSLIALIVSYRYKHLLAVEKVRIKISTDLHDSIGSGLTEITFLSQMLKTRVNQDEVANNQANNITNISKKLITDMRDIVWLVNPSKDSLKDLFYRLKDAYHDITQHSDINIKINNIENLTDIRLPMNFRQHIYLIFKEAINNSLKYSNCKNINVDITTESKKLKVILKDDGVGFDINTIKKGNGLNNMIERTKAINGEIEFLSNPKKGTTIIFNCNFTKIKSNSV